MLPSENLLAPARRGTLRPLFINRKLNFLFHWIDPVDQHPDAISQPVSFARTLTDDLACVFVEGITVVG